MGGTIYRGTYLRSQRECTGGFDLLLLLSLASDFGAKLSKHAVLAGEIQL